MVFKANERTNINTKLTENQVRDIRTALDNKTECPKRLASRFNLTPETIRRIGRRFSFAWIGE